MRARYYDPTTGRFIKEEPIGLAGGINLYAYEGGNPVGFIDPSGLWSVSLEGYWVIGGGVNIAYEDGTLEILPKLGVGYGGGFSYNPYGTPSRHSQSEGSGFIARTTVSVGASANVGIVSVDLNTTFTSGNAITTPVGDDRIDLPSGIQFALDKPSYEVKLGAFAGVEVGGYTVSVRRTHLQI
jgi:uncharacterized protein RhaS with RHS repeats